MKNVFLAVLTLLSVHLAAQSDAVRRPGEILVQLMPGASLQTIIETRSDVSFRLLETVAPNWRMYLLGFDETGNDPNRALELVRRIPGVQAAQFNHRSTERDLTPDDPSWSQQIEMDLIHAPEVWAATTGGLTPAGDTIVAAVLEKGSLLTHPDLVANRWHNWHEIPNNGIDDDGNGYIDDYAGYDVRTKNDSTGNKGDHGTGVNGIIGAVGNNGVGVTGVNWNVKLMNLSDVEYESEIIESYHYVDVMRRLYNTSNGKKGAFVVTTNASFGVDLGKPADHPLWCAVYDSLGQDGILSVAATTNANVNVDVDGDMPTQCPSQYLVAVNNVDQNGTKMPNTGYGTTSIDLAAPGNNTWTTANLDPNGGNKPGYGRLGGCSAAAPHVTGAIALLYSLSCKVFTADALTNPAGCATRVREIILQNTQPEPTLAGFTVTGGYLNLSLALAAVRKLCNGVVGPLSFLSVRNSVDNGVLTVFYQTPDFENYNFRVFNMLGQLVHEETLIPSQFDINFVKYDMSNLPQGVYVMAICQGKTCITRKFRNF
jgi:hypothetical protein